MRTYGAEPHNLGQFIVKGNEQFKYQYLPIKLPKQHGITVEPRLSLPFQHIIGAACCDFIGLRGLDAYVNSYVYITAKRKYQTSGNTITRPGWHTDGFMTDDINYIWSDVLPTVCNRSQFNLTLDDRISMEEMVDQASPESNYQHEENILLRLDQFVVHTASNTPYTGIRTFVKISFSKDQYDLEGNSVNYSLIYNWKTRPRENSRNIPQLLHK